MNVELKLFIYIALGLLLVFIFLYGALTLKDAGNKILMFIGNAFILITTVIGSIHIYTGQDVKEQTVIAMYEDSSGKLVLEFDDGEAQVYELNIQK